MQYRKLNELKKLPNNPRIIRDKQFKTLCDSIRDNPKYFEARPIILSNRTGEMVIIAGNQRYEAAKSLKLKEVPTFLIEGLDEAKEREITIRDNISNGEFDFDLLANEWSDLPLVEWGVDLPEDWLNPIEEIEPLTPKGNLADRFGIPPFSVLNAREGWWQERKRAWIALGIQSEVGRGGNLLNFSEQCNAAQRGEKPYGGGQTLGAIAPNQKDILKRTGSYASKTKNFARCFGQDLMRKEHIVGGGRE